MIVVWIINFSCVICNSKQVPCDCYDEGTFDWTSFVLSERNSYLFSLLIAVLGSVLFAGKAIFIKLSYRYGASSEVLLALRMIFSFPLFWLIFYFSKEYKSNIPITRKDLYQLAWLGFSGYFLSSYLDFLGLFYFDSDCHKNSIWVFNYM